MMLTELKPHTEPGEPAEYQWGAVNWSRFAREQWDLAPCVIRSPFSQPFAALNRIMSTLTELGERFRAGEAGSVVQCYREDGFVLSGPQAGKWLPRNDDCTAEEYTQRTAERLGCRGCALIVNDYLTHDPDLWQRILHFLAGLQQEVSPLFCRSGLFFGNYDSTPFGIHRDDVGALMFILEGRKRIHTWPDGYFDGRRDGWNSLEYEQYLSDALTLEGEPGDILYWPASVWHVGESVGGLSVSLNIGIRPADLRAERLEQLLTHLEENIAPGHERDESGNDHEVLLAEMRRYWEQMTHEGDWKEALRQRWLERESAGGFEVVPAPKDWLQLPDHVTVRGCPMLPIRWTAVGMGEILCAAHGHSFRIPANPRVIHLLERLNQGQPSRIESLIREYSGDCRVDDVRFVASEKGIRALLSRLTSLRALTVG